MELIALSISLCIAFLDTGWGSKPETYHSLCKLVERTAYCNGRRLSSILEDLPAGTKELFLDANVIQALRNASLVQYHVLHSLSLCENGLQLIEPGAFLGTRSLSVLSMANNALSTNYSVTASALWTLPALRKLDLSGNQLTEVMMGTLIQHLSSLESLSVARNAIMRLDDSHFRNLTKLQHLDLQQNYIFEIEAGAFEGVQGLRQLNLAYNYIPCIVQFDLTQLRMLNVSYNHVEWFMAAESDAAFELETLDLSHNQLLFFPLLPRQNKLQTLLLAHNQLNFYGNFSNNSSENSVQLLFLDGNVTNITTHDLWEENSHSNLSSLSFLDLSWNRLWYLPDRFFEGVASLAHLNLSHNCLKALHLQEKELLNTLINLDLSYNQLLDLQVNLGPGGSLPNLRTLNLSSNKLHGLPAKIFTHTPKITTVDLSKNPIEICPPYSAGSPSCIDLNNIASMRNLFLAACDLEVLGSHTFKGTSLEHLDLSNNPRLLLNGLRPLQGIAWSLQVLSLRQTGLSTAGTKLDFSAFQKLVNLDLSENFLTSFPESLASLSLHTLDLRRNGLHTLPQHAMQNQLGRSLHVIYLSQNPYDCCKIGWWHTLHGLGTICIADSSQVTCNFSSRFFRVAHLPDLILQNCKWQTADMTLFYLVLILPTCLVLLVASVIISLTFRQHILQIVKSRYRTSSPY
ncbi:transforming growth factor beta activator LRRC33 [Elgaria multicarinata webbii]|uniref:transforming growth factor beta activator LRRC33 n=1 Tax=Elgaria multicarinata webbii TaxID=159646 RepID=UPI002FCD31EF